MVINMTGCYVDFFSYQGPGPYRRDLQTPASAPWLSAGEEAGES